MRRWAHVIGGAMLALGSTLAPVACYQPRLTSCKVACDQQHGCPGSLQCIGGLCTDGVACGTGDGGGDGGDGGEDTPADVPDGAIVCSSSHDASTDLPAVGNEQLILWLDPDDIESGTSTFVWRDHSGNQNDATASGSARPTLVPAAGGLPAGVHFSGDGQYLTVPGTAASFREGVAIFMVIAPEAQPASSDPYRVTFVDFAETFGSESSAIIFGQEDIATGTDGDTLAIFEALPQGSNTGDLPPSIPGVITDGSRQLLELVASYVVPPGAGGSAGLLKNGVAIAGGFPFARPPLIGRGSNLIGRSNIADQPGHPDFRGTIYEVIIYAGIVAAPSRTQIESYLLARWCL
jgi:hypothetical protein